MIIKLIIDDYNKLVVSDIDQMINTITEKKPVKYISNGVELNTTFIEYYFEILDMDKGKLFNIEMILTQVKKQQTYYQEDVAVGYKHSNIDPHIEDLNSPAYSNASRADG